MTHVFLDTNVIIDFLADRKPFANDAASLFDRALKREIVIHVSAVSYNNIFYIMRQYGSQNEVMRMLEELFEWTEVIDVSGKIISDAMRFGFKDFEDAIQYQCALSNKKVEMIITRDSKDFKLSTLPVLTPREVISLLGF
ncbi:MAG: PIN domain-containing protein [bacterium]|nr:PIN domain-containing protein [bacterium]